ncbi:hypothetical protein BDR07DRAFT_757661 [Suillus spraguei]|nr:hypothetical protein BDR07DRAFT_757661 [Suillus spraguei]
MNKISLPETVTSAHTQYGMPGGTKIGKKPHLLKQASHVGLLGVWSDYSRLEKGPDATDLHHDSRSSRSQTIVVICTFCAVILWRPYESPAIFRLLLCSLSIIVMASASSLPLFIFHLWYLPSLWWCRIKSLLMTELGLCPAFCASIPDLLGYLEFVNLFAISIQLIDSYS